jgi:predicted DNA repair protein MutK
MLGGAFLCFEGVEKVLHSLEARKHKEDPAQRQQRLQALAERDPLAFERDKVKGRFAPILFCPRKLSPSPSALWRKRRCSIRS